MIRTTRSISASSSRRRSRWSARRPDWRLAAAALALLLSGLGVAAEAAGPFGEAGGGEGGLLPALPAWLRAVVAEAIRLQEAFHHALLDHVREAGGNLGLGPVLATLGVAFAYGVFHALGPGHGKAVVAGYFLARRARVWRGVLMGSAIALVQALSAILLVTVPALLLHVSSRDVMASADILEMASYGLILGLGLFMAWGVLTGRGCGHDHDEETLFDGRPPHDGHRHDHGPHDHAAHDHCLHDVAPHGGRRRLARAGVIGTALAVGIRPCTGAILVLLFTLANGLLGLGVAATLAMGLGVAITISALGVGTIGLRHTITRLGGRGAATARVAQTGLQLAGSAAVIALGGIMLLAALARGSAGPGLFLGGG